jgi:hypothetical protein
MSNAVLPGKVAVPVEIYPVEPVRMVAVIPGSMNVFGLPLVSVTVKGVVT